MKILSKVCLSLLGLCAINTAIAFSVTACASRNPYTNNKTGDAITIKSKKDATNCDAIAKTYIVTSPPVPHEPFTPDNWPPVALNLITNGWIDQDDLVFGRAFASTQVYWELVHNMCSNYKSGTSSITVIGSDFGNGQCTFFDLDEDDTTVKLSLGVTISCVNFFNNSTWANQNAIGYGLPTDGNPHFTLNFANAESGSQSIVSYGLWNRTN